jgi:hypothetical protein
MTYAALSFDDAGSNPQGDNGNFLESDNLRIFRIAWRIPDQDLLLDVQVPLIHKKKLFRNLQYKLICFEIWILLSNYFWLGTTFCPSPIFNDEPIAK